MAETGVDLDLDIINSDGSVNYRTVVGDVGAIGGAAACAALGLGAAAAFCGQAGGYIAKVIYDLGDLLFGKDVPHGSTFFVGPVPDYSKTLASIAGEVALRNPELLRRLFIVRSMALSSLSTYEGLAAHYNLKVKPKKLFTIVDAYNAIGGPPFPGWTWLIARSGFGTAAQDASCANTFASPANWLMQTFPNDNNASSWVTSVAGGLVESLGGTIASNPGGYTLNPTKYDNTWWWGNARISMPALDPKGYDSGGVGNWVLYSVKYRAWGTNGAPTAIGVDTYAKYNAASPWYEDPNAIPYSPAPAWHPCGTTGAHRVNVFYPAASYRWLAIDPANNNFGTMSTFEFDAQVSAWAQAHKANIAKFLARVNSPMLNIAFELSPHAGGGGGSSSGGSGGSDSGTLVLIGLGIAAAVAVAVSSKKS